jgi:hypothetical protein
MHLQERHNNNRQTRHIPNSHTHRSSSPSSRSRTRLLSRLHPARHCRRRRRSRRTRHPAHTQARCRSRFHTTTPTTCHTPTPTLSRLPYTLPLHLIHNPTFHLLIMFQKVIQMLLHIDRVAPHSTHRVAEVAVIKQTVRVCVESRELFGSTWGLAVKVYAGADGEGLVL